MPARLPRRKGESEREWRHRNQRAQARRAPREDVADREDGGGGFSLSDALKGVGSFLGFDRPRRSNGGAAQSGSGSERKLSGWAPKNNPSTPPLEALIAALQGGGGSGVGGMIGGDGGIGVGAPILTAPDLASYTQPFDDASTKAREAHAAAVPVLEGIFEELRQGLRGSLNDQMAQAELVNKDQDARAQAVRQTIDADTAASRRDLAGQAGPGGPVGSATAAVEQGAGNLQAHATQAAADDRNLGARLDQLARQSSTERQNDAGLAEASSLSDAQLALSSILQQLGVGRAEAVREHGNTVNEVNQQNFQNQLALDEASYARRADGEGEASERDALLRQTEFEVVSDLLGRYNGSPQRALEGLNNGLGTALAMGYGGTGGQQVDLGRMTALVHLLAPSARKALADERAANTPEGDPDLEQLLAAYQPS